MLHRVFIFEQEVYVKEGIDWSMLEFEDNQAVIDLIQKKPVGILILLDDQAKMGDRVMHTYNTIPI